MAARREIPQRARFERSPLTRALVQSLMALQPGEVASYSQLSAVIGADIFGCRHLLTSARAKAERQFGAVFDSVHRVGVKRLTPAGVVNLGEGYVDRIRRTTWTAARKVATISNPAQLLRADRARLLVVKLRLGALDIFSDNNARPPTLRGAASRRWARFLTDGRSPSAA